MSRFKTLIKKSSNSVFLTKFSSHYTFSPGSFKSNFQFDSSWKFPGRKSSSSSESSDSSGKPFSLSDAISRVFATPSVHGQVLQCFGFSTFFQLHLEEKKRAGVKPALIINNPSNVSSILQSGVTSSGQKIHKLDARFHHTMCIEEIEPEYATTFAIIGLSKSHKNSIWKEGSQNFDVDLGMRFGMVKGCEFEESDDVGNIEECKVELYDVELLGPEHATFKFLYAQPYLSSINGLLQNAVQCIIYGVNALKQLDLLFESSPLNVVSVIRKKASTRSLNSKGLRLFSGACYFPHPDKEFTGGEDAYFICPDKQVIGVADGVGAWADMGVDAGEYARQLMSESLIAALEEPMGCVDTARVLKKAHSKTTCRGSSTACILALSDYGLQAVNVGDSGFLVLRNGHLVFKSPVQQHTFNLPYQLESHGGDPVSSAELFVVDVAEGDVIVAGTDGLFDNLYATEMASIVLQSTICGLSPDITAQKIAYMAREHAKDRHRQTPFSAAAQDAGFHFSGGKMDDITVVVSYVTDCTFP